MFLDIAKPIALLLCILTLLATFHAAFLVPASEIGTRTHDGFALLLLYAGISILSGLLFREPSAHEPTPTTLAGTLPMQIFYWSTAVMLVLFAVSWYIETYFLPYASAH